MISRYVAVILCALLLMAPLSAAADIAAIKTQVRDFHAAAAPIEVKLSTGAKLQGAILRVETDTFAIRQKTGQEVSVPFSDVAAVKKRGRISKAVLIPAIIGGTALFLCVAPYPLGFLCRKDPS